MKRHFFVFSLNLGDQRQEGKEKTLLLDILPKYNGESKKERKSVREGRQWIREEMN